MITTFEQLPDLRKSHRNKNIVLTCGVFDIVHEGHAYGMEQCKKYGDLLIVGVNNDERVRARKGEGRPIRNEVARIALISMLKPVDYAFIMPDSTANEYASLECISQLKPDIFMDSIEYYDKWLDKAADVEAMGTRFIFETGEKVDASTNIIQRIIQRYSPEVIA